MDISGNLNEIRVTIGNKERRTNSDLHGNGSLDINGDADAPDQPNKNGIGIGWRGSRWYSVIYLLCTSNRFFASLPFIDRDGNIGFRGVRTAP